MKYITQSRVSTIVVGRIPPRGMVTAFDSVAMSEFFLYFVAGPHPRHLCLRRCRGSALLGTTVRLVTFLVGGAPPFPPRLGPHPQALSLAPSRSLGLRAAAT